MINSFIKYKWKIPGRFKNANFGRDLIFLVLLSGVGRGQSTDQPGSLLTINFSKLHISVPWSEQIAHLKAAI